MGASAIKMKRDGRMDTTLADEKYVTDFIDQYYIEMHQRFTKLNPKAQMFYTEQLDAADQARKELGNVFATKSREEFENSVTDIMQFEPVVRTLIAIRVLEIENDSKYSDVQLLDVPVIASEENHQAIEVQLNDGNPVST